MPYWKNNNLTSNRKTIDIYTAQNLRPPYLRLLFRIVLLTAQKTTPGFQQKATLQYKESKTSLHHSDNKHTEIARYFLNQQLILDLKQKTHTDLTTHLAVFLDQTLYITVVQEESY